MFGLPPTVASPSHRDDDPVPSVPLAPLWTALWRESWSAIVVRALVLAVATAIGAGNHVLAEHAGMVEPSIGIAALWMVRYADRPRWWLDRHFLRAAAIIAVLVPAVLVALGTPLSYAAPRGLGALCQGIATAWLCRVVLGRFVDQRSVAALTKLFLVTCVGAIADLPFAPLALESIIAANPLVVALWVIRGAASAFTVIVLVIALTERPVVRLAPPSRTTVLIVFAVTLLVYAAGFDLLQRLYLMLPLSIWAASALTLRGAAAHSALSLLATSVLASHHVGPFALGDAWMTAFTTQTYGLIVVFVTIGLVRVREARAALLEDLDRRRQAAVDHAELFETMVHSVDDGVVIVDADGSVVLANEAARVIADRVEGGLERLLGGTDALSRVLGGRHAETADVVIGGALGHAPEMISVRAFALARGYQRRAVVLLRDVTPERRYTEDLRAFAHTVAHDLRNPITGMALSAELGRGALLEEAGAPAPAASSGPAAAASSGPAPAASPGQGSGQGSGLGEGTTAGRPPSPAAAEAVEMFDQIVAAADRASRLIDNIMDYRVSDGSALRKEPVRLDQLVTAVANARRLGGSGLQLEVAAPVTLHADPRLLERLFDNLLSNAVKYAVPGRAAEVAVSALDRGDGWCLILVEDRGIGLPAGQEWKVFDEFHRVPEHRQFAGGSGVGLAICRRAVERHGGTITASRREGGGTRFVILLPSQSGRSAQQSAPTAATPVAAPAAAPTADSSAPAAVSTPAAGSDAVPTRASAPARSAPAPSAPAAADRAASLQAAMVKAVSNAAMPGAPDRVSAGATTGRVTPSTSCKSTAAIGLTCAVADRLSA